ncbi:MAG: hypothetical protein JW915_18250 [Chitinispirillaceae bacterium]|nr:hypothetical protein [Chitinispirillaceae bacterium]
MNIDSYPERKTLQAAYMENYPHYHTAISELSNDIQARIDTLDIHVTVKGRVKSFESYFEKLLKRLEKKRNTGQMEPIHDILAFRVVCPFLEDTTKAEEKLRSAYIIHDVERKGENHTIGEFGYNCTHLVLEIPERIRQLIPLLDIATIEVQIRTILQDAWAEVEHELIYKSHIAPLDTPLRRKLAAINATLTLSDITFQEIRDYQRQLHKELYKRRLSFAAEQPGQIEYNNHNEKTFHETSESEYEIRSMETNIRNMDDLLVEALHAHNQKNYMTAVELYTRILQSSIDKRLRTIVLIHRGIAYFCQKHYEMALEDFTAATHCEPDNSRAFYHLGTVNRVMGNHSSAIRHLQQSLRLNPYRLEALMESANVLFEMKNYSAVLEYCEKALRINPESPPILKLHSMAQAKIS